MPHVKHIACMLTGSIESAVTALLLRKSGCQVLGVFVRNPYMHENATERQLEYVHKVGKHLDIPLQEVVLGSQEWSNFISHVNANYHSGHLPALDILYNKHIIFGSIFSYVDKIIGVDAFATEFYARRSNPEDISSQVKRQGVKLYKAVDQFCDQSMLLCQVSQKSLQQTLLPLGEFTAEVVYKIAKKAALPVCHASRATSFDVSSVISGINKELPKENGTFIHFESGTALGTYEGIHTYKVGEKVKIGDKHFYILEKMGDKGTITVVEQDDHPALFSNTLFTELAHWIHTVPYNFYEKHTMDCEFRKELGQPVVQCTLTVGAHNEYCGNDHIILSSATPMKAITPGNYAVFYKGEECLGSARIVRAGPSLHIVNSPSSSSNHRRTPTKPSSFTFGKFFKKIL